MTSAIIIICTFMSVASIVLTTTAYNRASTTANECLYSAEIDLFADRDAYSSNDEFTNEFIHIVREIMPDSQAYDVNIYGVDYKKGLLDAEIVCYYDTVYNQTRNIAVRRTMIFDKEKDSGTSIDDGLLDH